MSDSSNSTGSSGSSTNSWTLLSPEEVAIENVGPADDGTESLGDAPSLSEEVAGAAAEFKPADIPVETVLSEEGHQVCQETSPESSEGPVPSSPARMSPRPSTPRGPPDLDMESQPPVIHDIVASSPSDNEHLGGVSFVTNIDLSAPLHVPEVDLAEQLSLAPSTAESPVPPELDTPADSGDVTAEPDPPTETPSGVEAGRGETPEPKEPPPSDPEPPLTGQTDDGPATEPVWSGEEEEDEEPEEMPAQEEEEEDVESSSSFQDGLRRRNVASLDAGRARTSDEEEDEEEVEVKLPQREEKPWLSVNKCIVGALVLLFLGSLFLSGDFDASEQSDGEHVQDWIRPDPQDMKTLMNKLQQENQEIRQLETELQWKTEALDSEMRAAAASGDEKGRADLEAENVKLKAELSSLPELKAELEQLRARVTELSRLSAAPPAAPSSSQSDDVAGREPQTVQDAGAEGTLKDKLQQQQVLLMESKRRLEGMNRDGGGGKRLQDGLEEIRRKLSEHVENLGNMKLPDNNGRRSDRRGKDDKKEWKHSKEGGKKENRKEERKDRKEERKDRKEERKDRKDERKDRKEERKDRKDERKDRKDERKPPNENPHKESWRKHQDEWERKKDERREDREQRRREKPWHRRPEKSPHQPPRQHHGDFWKDQELKLHRNVRPRLDCRSPEDCAAREGLYPVELQEFEALLEGYLSKLEKSSAGSKNAIRRLTAEFFEDGVFIHDRALFGSFAEDVADVLEDMVDLFEAGRMHDDSLEEEMEEFEREAMWKFAATA